MNTAPTTDTAYQAILANIESGEPGMLIACPHCHSRAIIRTSRAMTLLTRDAYCQCTNLACGHTFRAVLEIVETISPSAVPDPDVSAKLLHTGQSSPARRPSGGAAVTA